MELSEFIKESILEIAKGVNMARQEIKPNMGDVNPEGNFIFDGFPSIKVKGVSEKHDASAPITKISYKLHVQVQESSEVDGRAKAGFLNVISASANGQTSESTFSMQELSFELALKIPRK